MDAKTEATPSQAGPTLETLDIDAILRCLPHRYPFLMIDRVIELDGFQRAVAIKNVTINEPFFQGHWPEQPIMPGVLQLEAMAQLAGVLSILAVALLIAASWAWGSVTVMQRNFALQKDADEQQRQLQLTQLEVDTLQYQQNYYKSDEYKDLAARKFLGLASPGEKVLILPPNSQAAKEESRPKSVYPPSSPNRAALVPNTGMSCQSLPNASRLRTSWRPTSRRASSPLRAIERSTLLTATASATSSISIFSSCEAAPNSGVIT